MSVRGGVPARAASQVAKKHTPKKMEKTGIGARKAEKPKRKKELAKGVSRAACSLLGLSWKACQEMS
jgi:hypothetical protein